MKNEMNQKIIKYKSRNMKRYLLIIALLLGAVSSWGQIANDQAAVLQKIIELPDLQQYYPKNGAGSLKQICIMQYPTAFSAEVTTALDASKVVFRSREAIEASHTEAYFIFRSLEVDANSAKAIITYFYNFDYTSNQFKMLTINVELQKSGAVWNITNVNLGGGR